MVGQATRSSRDQICHLIHGSLDAVWIRVVVFEGTVGPCNEVWWTVTVCVRVRVFYGL